MAPTQTVQHHHRSTTKSTNKPFKSRHATKSALKEQTKGKVERLERGVRRTPHQQVMSKIQRRNQAKQLRQNKLDSRREEGSVFVGRDGAPRVVALIPLCQNVRIKEVVDELTSSIDVEDAMPATSNNWRVDIPRFKQKLQFLTPNCNLIACLDAARVADFVLFVLSAEQEVDEVGEQMLRCIESQGISTVLTGVSDLHIVEPAKKRPDVLKSLKSFINHFFAAQEKVHDLHNRQDCSNVMRSLCTLMPKGIKWRDERSWMNIDEVDWTSEGPVVTGVVRGRGLKADRLVEVGDWGDFQIAKITSAHLESTQKRPKTNDMAVDAVEGDQTLEEPSEDQDDLAELAPEMMMEDLPAASMAPSDRRAVLLDDHHYFHKDEDAELKPPTKLPRGTSKYQAAWFLGDISDSGSDMEDVDDDMDELDVDNDEVHGPAEGNFDDVMHEPTEVAPSEYPQSEAFFDRAPEDEAQQIEAYRKQRHNEADEDLEFPDEIELHPNVNARERLAKYRGLKSLRTSDWNTEEDKPYEPLDWTRLLEISDYKSAKNRAVKEAMTGGVKAGTRVHVFLKISKEQTTELQSLPTPTSLFSLLRHEHKRSAVNTSINLSSEYSGPIKSKETLIMQCGPRRLIINPLYSAIGNTPNNVHKFDRYLHPGRSAVATFIGPIIWGSVPCLYFKSLANHSDPVQDLAQSMDESGAGSNHLELVATGTSLPPSTDRIVAKRIILTGHPYKIHKKLVTVRYMFFNAEDVEYFRALQLWTKRGRSGFVKETLGTHGYFKATFDGKINPLDAVAISLYKRVWPRPSKRWVPGQEDQVPQLVDTELS